MIEDNDLDKTQEFTIESDADYYGKNEELLKRHYDLEHTKGHSPVKPNIKGSFPKGAPRYNKPPVMPKDYRENARFPNNVHVSKPQLSHKPQMPHEEPFVYKANSSPKKWYRTSDEVRNNGKIEEKKPKIKLSKIFIIAAAILAGGVVAVTIGDHIVSNIRDTKLKDSQQNIQAIDAKSGTRDIDYYTNEDNTIYILNNKLNDLLKKYKQNPNSVYQGEVAELLKMTYQSGRKVAFSKIADAYNNYSIQNEENPEKIDSSDLVYRIDTDNYPCYYVAYCPNKRDNINGHSIAENSKLSDFVEKQLVIKNLFTQDPSNDALYLADGVTIKKAISYLKEGVTDINKMYSSDVHYEKKLLGGKTLVINEYERETQPSDSNSSTTSAENLKTDNSSDLANEER